MGPGPYRRHHPQQARQIGLPLAGPGPQLGRWVSTAARRWPRVSAGVGIVAAVTVVLQCSPKPDRLTAAICIPTAYLGAERAAETDQLGACAVPGGFTPPWDWRHSMRREPLHHRNAGRWPVPAARKSAASPRPRRPCTRGNPSSTGMCSGWSANRCGRELEDAPSQA